MDIDKLKNKIRRNFLYKIVKEPIRILIVFILNKTALLFHHKLEDKIVFATAQGTYTCNPKAICDEVIRQELPYKLVWAKERVSKNEKKDQYPESVKVVKKGTYEFYKEVNTAKVLIDNEHNFGRRYYYRKRRGQLFLETWHGSMGIKKIAVDNSLSAHLVIKRNKFFAKDFDYVISNSDFENKVYRSTYWPKTPILEYGHARNDIFFKDKNSKEIKELDKKVREALKIDKDTKILLYAPTFREKDREVNNKLEINYDEIRKAMEKRFGGKWQVVVRFHHKEKYYHKGYDKEHNVIDATFYPDMQDLLAVVDAGITDYSSWICDFMLTNRPSFILGEDLESYSKSDRGFYYDLDELPCSISESSDELVKNILDFDDKKYESKRLKYLKLRGCFEKGNATIQIVDLIKKHMNKKK